jgi:hypothetical protein
MGRLGDQRGLLLHQFGGPLDLAALRRDAASRNRRLGPGAAFEQAAFDEEQVYAALQDRTLGTASSQRA